jgi:HAE1 family hydrophobic/amphiphilic exporter-1
MKVSFAVPRCALSILGILGLVLAFTIVPPPVIIAQDAAPSAQASIKQPAGEDLPPLPFSPIEKAQKDGTALMLSLKDVTKLALQNNLDIAIQDLNEDVSQQKIIAAYGNYDPTLSGNLSFNSSKQANTVSYQASSGAFNTTKTLNWDYQFRQNFRKTGGSLSAGWNDSRTATDQTSYQFNPSYSSRASISFTQPLLRNFRIDSNRGNIKLANLDIKSTDSQFKQKVTDTISNIQSQYWDLVAAIRDYEIKRNSVKLGQITLRDNKKKVNVGTLAQISITEAQADLAQRELNLFSSEETIARQENALRQLISNDRNADIWSKTVVPTDTPDFREYKFDLQTAIETALKNRPELEQIDIQLNQADINLQMTANSRKWQMDLTGSFGSNGNAGSPANPLFTPSESQIGGLATSYKNVFTGGATNWTLKLAVSVPLRNRSTDSQYAQQQINRRKTLMQRKNQEQSIQVEIRNAIQKIDTNRKQVETAKMGRQLSEEQLAGEVKRLEAGLSENFRVLDRQNQLAQAEFTYLTNLINYKKSVISLQKSMYMLLESNEFELAKGSSSHVPELK